jgi:hypothetical protein
MRLLDRQFEQQLHAALRLDEEVLFADPARGT